MDLTPRQMAAFLYFGDAIDREERAMALHIGLLGARGTEEAVKKSLAELKQDPLADDAPARPKFPPGAKVERRARKP